MVFAKPRSVSVGPGPRRFLALPIWRYRGRVAGQRPQRSAGTTVLLDAVRRPPRYRVFPPGAQESLVDIQAVQAGEARRVGCFVRGESGPWPRRYRRGTLQVRGQVASWARLWGHRRSQVIINVRGTSVIEARPAGRQEQRFGSPGNIHLFALVRCTSPAGRVDLVVPAADVPLMTWFFGGQPEAPDAALLASAVTPGPGRKLANRKRGWVLSTAGCGLMAGTVAAVALVPGPSVWWIRIPYGIGCLLVIRGVTSIVHAHRQKQRE